MDPKRKELVELCMGREGQKFSDADFRRIQELIQELLPERASDVPWAQDLVVSDDTLIRELATHQDGSGLALGIVMSGPLLGEFVVFYAKGPEEAKVS